MTQKDAGSVIVVDDDPDVLKITSLISEEPLRMNMESNILRMALIHLVKNATEATPAGGQCNNKDLWR